MRPLRGHAANQDIDVIYGRSWNASVAVTRLPGGV
jgi:hypothetical protein